MWQIALYSIWVLFPVVFFVLSLWAKLEQWGDKEKKQNPGDFFRQGLFVSAAVAIAMLIDQYLLEKAVEAFSPEMIPLEFYQVMLLPIILLITAKLIGPSKAISITDIPKPTSRRRR